MDGDACPVREEVFRVAARRDLPVAVVSNGARGPRLPDDPRISRVVVADGPDAADDWIAGRIGPGDLCVTADLPLAARCLGAGAAALSPAGRAFDASNIGAALAGREIARHLRETTGGETRHAAFSSRDRARFLVALDAALDRLARPAPPAARPLPDFFSE